MKNQNTHPNGLYFCTEDGVSFFWREIEKPFVHFNKISGSSLFRIIQLTHNPNFTYDPFGQTIYIRRKYADGY